ncbi:MAG: hypothetical protein CVU89_08425 [Firmicutes bacterium HGW-Firmicutes-14]|nr:MAG: hypothetical protein CVU89_08425 [Firmicutes bacterium HGW-Firmicutes-14]
MKKLFIAALTLLMVTGICTVSFAAPPPKAVSVSLTSSSPEVNSGETVTFTAVTLKHGSDYRDEWIGADKIETVLTEDGYYISTAQVTAQSPVNVQYKITMSAGASDVTFTGQAETTVSVSLPVPVTATREITGVEVKNISPFPEIAGMYSGDVYIVFSDGTSDKYSTIYFCFNEGETSKVLYISVSLDGIKYSFAVNVSK